MIEPVNDLERAYLDAHLGVPETVAYFKELRDSVVSFLMPYHPEFNGVLQVGNGSSVTFLLWQINGEPMIPLFTSAARAEEALHAAGKMDEKNLLGEMLGKELLHLISMLPDEYNIVVNPACAMGSRMMNHKMITSVVDGSALAIPTPGELAMNGLVISLPDRQPIQLRAPLCRFLSGLPEVKAAWLFFEEEPKPPHERVYAVGIMLAGGDAEELKRETALALAGACPPEWDSRAMIMDPQDPGFNDIMHCVPPFYKTTDFQPPAKLPEPMDQSD